VKKKNQ